MGKVCIKIFLNILEIFESERESYSTIQNP